MKQMQLCNGKVVLKPDQQQMYFFIQRYVLDNDLL